RSRAQTRSRRLVHAPTVRDLVVADDHDPVDLARSFLRDEPESHVPEDEARVALPRVAVTAAAGRPHLDDVARGHRLLGGEHAELAAVGRAAVDEHGLAAALAAAADAPRLEAVAIAENADHRVRVEHLVGMADSRTAAPASGAGGVRRDLELAHPDREEALVELDGLVVRAGREQRHPGSGTAVAI